MTSTPQTLEAVLAVAADRLGPAVDDALHALGELHAGHAALAAQHDLRAFGLQALADELLVGAEAIQRRGVEQRDAEVERVVQELRTLFRPRRHAIGVAQVHAAQPDRPKRRRAAIRRVRQAHSFSCCSSWCSVR